MTMDAGRFGGFRPAATGMYIKDASPQNWGVTTYAPTTYAPSWQNVFNSIPENEQTKLIKSYCEKIGKDICWQITLLHNELLAVEKRLCLQLPGGDGEVVDPQAADCSGMWQPPGTPAKSPQSARRWRSESPHRRSPRVPSPSRRDEGRQLFPSVEAVGIGGSQFSPEMMHMRAPTVRGKVGGNSRYVKQANSRVTWSRPGTAHRENSNSRPGTAPREHSQVSVLKSPKAEGRIAIVDEPSPSEGGQSPTMRPRDQGSHHRTTSPPRPKADTDMPTAPVGTPPPLPPIPNKLPDEENAWTQPPVPALTNKSETQKDDCDRRGSNQSRKTSKEEATVKRKSRDSQASESEVVRGISYRSVPSPRSSMLEDAMNRKKTPSLRKAFSKLRSKSTLGSGSEDKKPSEEDSSQRISSPGSAGMEARRVGFASTCIKERSEEEDDEVEVNDGKDEANGATSESSERQMLSPVRATDTIGDPKPVLSRGASTNARRALLQMLNDDPNRGGFLGMVRAVVVSPWFEYVVAVALLSNAIFIGSRAEYRSQHPTESTPHVFTTAELVFGLLFTVELLMRIFVFRFDFLKMKGWEWNLFDLIVVSLQFIESIFDLVGAAVSDQKGVQQLSILGMLRLGRIVRLLRMVRLVPALKSMVYLIAASMQSFFWTVVLLALLMFGVAVHFTEMIADYRQDNEGSFEITELQMKEIEESWGSLLKSITSLYQAILGGVDWKDLTDQIDMVSFSASVVFAMYIAFASLVMLNLVTGVFVEGAQRIVADDRDAELVKQAKKMFDIVDDQHDHQITWHEFAVHLEDPGMAEYFRLVGISRKEAKDLFQLLDHDHSGTLSIKEFVHGCLGLRGPAKSIDLARLAYNHELQGRRLGHIEDMVQAEFALMTEKVTRVAKVFSEAPQYDERTEWEGEMLPLQRGMPSFYYGSALED